MKTQGTVVKTQNTFARFGDVAILVGDCVLYGPLTHLLWERGIAVLRVAGFEELPRVRAGGEPRAALVCTVTVSNDVNRHVKQWGKALGRLPVLVELHPTGELIATVDQETGKPDEWTAELPWIIRLARTEGSR